MRAHFLVGIIRAAEGDAPPEQVDFMVEFDPPIIAIKFCPFCGADINQPDAPMRVGSRLAPPSS